MYELRPPALDELGLVSALREHAARTLTPLSGLSDVPVLHVEVDAPDHLPLLPAAVEVAVYRIAIEALNNAIRHAAARTCLIRVGISLDAALCLEVRDDGRGLPPVPPAGLGLASTRERAAELGGTCTIETVSPGGTRVLVRLPLPPAEEDA